MGCSRIDVQRIADAVDASKRPDQGTMAETIWTMSWRHERDENGITLKIDPGR
jgi:hypothetical protein